MSYCISEGEGPHLHDLPLYAYAKPNSVWICEGCGEAFQFKDDLFDGVRWVRRTNRWLKNRGLSK